jgi:ribose transport system permease protein/ribose transport system ATP-binding protein
VEDLKGMSTNPAEVSTVVLSVRGVSKRFGVVQALREVSLECRAGEIHAVVGENGSGKSTLLGIASGVLAPDVGGVEIAGRRLETASASEAQRLGFGMAYQTFSEVLELSVAENLYLATPRHDRPRYAEMESWASATLERLDLRVPARTRVGSLAFAERQLLEVVKALQCKPKVLALDEPTTALGPDEVDRLHALVLELVAEGVGVIYVSHRLPEVMGVAHRVTVLRDGVGQGTFEATQMSEERLITLMIARPLDRAFPERDRDSRLDEPVLEISQLQGNRFGPIDLRVYRGEILGLAGAEGNGQVPFLRSLAGVERATGSVRCNGAKINLKSPLSALRAGIVLLSADRAQSVFAVLGVRPNTTLQVLRRFSRLGWIRRSKERETVLDVARRLRMRIASIEQPVQFLSGGNQQKVALARPFLRRNLNVILAEEPTQGVDVQSRFDIYEALRANAREGVAAIVKSSDPIELSGLCDRVLVISRGRIIDELPTAKLDQKRIVEAMVGSKATAGRLSPTLTASAVSPSTMSRRPALTFRSWMPLALMVVLMIAIGGYTQSQNSAFLSDFNLNGLFIAAIPLALAAMAQTSALMIRAFDVSLGALITLGVVVASFTMPDGASSGRLLVGSLAVVGVCLCVGAFNILLTKVLGIASIIATLANLSILTGVALLLRPTPAGPISFEFGDFMLESVGFMPIASVGVLVVAILADVWLYRTGGGLLTRAVGLDETSAERLGARVGSILVRGFLVSAFVGALASLFLSSQILVGDPVVGIGYTLTSIAAAVLGGASLFGGRGSFVGAVIGALLLTELTIIVPFIGLHTSWAQMLVGALTLLALLFYQTPDIVRRLRALANDRGGPRSRRGAKPAAAEAPV